METKQLIERNLPFSNTYIYLDITRGSVMDGQCCNCDNCGKLITNMVHIWCKQTEKHHYIGTDCAETFSKAKCLNNNGMTTDFYLDVYTYNKVARLVSELRKGAELYNDGFFCSTTNSKGKRVDCNLIDLQKYFPEFLENQIVA